LAMANFSLARLSSWTALTGHRALIPGQLGPSSFKE
jgi:hypothetical protein